MKPSNEESVPIPESEITPEYVYMSRREFLKSMGLISTSVLLAACGVKPGAIVPTTAPGKSAGGTSGQPATTAGKKDELGDPANTFDQITHYNNYYEFTEDKQDVASLAEGFKTSPWTVEVGGLVNKPTKFSVDDLVKNFPQEERIYRLRCVEAWSMVIPWVGFTLSSLLKAVEPKPEAKYVAFQTISKSDQMPGLTMPFYPWPYDEGLRMDEAMHNLTILATGMYGKPLAPQNGAPIRLVVPWKYGFKGIKAIVKIDLVAEQPKTFWSEIAPDEYGFYANVNPDVPHPRWSQASERRIGETARRKTLPFNGYAAEVAQLYEGMDLKQNY